MRYRFLSIMLLLAALAQAAWQPIVRNHNSQEYQAGTQNWHMMQSSRGWIYASNNYGLVEHDGHDWRLYGVWNSSCVRCSAEGEDGAIYVGATNDFGVFRENEDYFLTYRSLADSIPSACRKFGEVWQIVCDEGLIYVQTRNYIFVCEENGHVDVIDPASIIYASIVRDHCLYVATSNGIFLYSGKRLHTLEGSDLLRPYIVSAIVPYGVHGFLIGTDFAGVFIYDGSSLRPFATEVDNFLHKNQLYSMAVNREHIAFGTVLRGLVVTNLKGQNPVYVDRAQGLQNSTVLSLSFDRDGNLWCGLDQGIDEVLFHSPIRFLNNNETAYGSGYTYIEHAGNRYFGTNQGLYVQHAGSDHLEMVDGSMGQVWKLVEIDNQLFCCHNRGLFTVGETGVSRFDIPEGAWNVLPLPGDELLICTYNGLYLLRKDGKNYVVAGRLRGYDETVLYAEIDNRGDIWTISSRGVERLTLKDDLQSVSPELVLKDPSRSLYSVNRIGEEVVVSADGYLAIVGADGQLHESDSLATLLDGKKKYEILRRDDKGNLVFLSGGRLLVRRFNSHGGHYDSNVSEVINNNTFFVGGFANLAFTANGDAVLGGVEGFFLMDMMRACCLAPVSEWTERQVKVYIPWYQRWWAWLLYLLLICLMAYLAWRYARQLIRYRDERLAAEREAEIQRQQLRIAQLEREQAQFDLKAKSRELNSALLNKVNRNEMSSLIQRDVRRIIEQVVHGEIDAARKGLLQLDARLSAGVHEDKDWEKFEQNFDFANDRFLQKLSTRFPWMNKQEKKLCVYIYMGLQTKEIAPLLNLSTRGVEMMRYRIRKKMDLDAQANMKAYFEQMLSQEDAE